MRRTTTEEFVTKSLAVWKHKDKNGNHKYNYEKAEYTTSKGKVTIFCYEHNGYFEQEAMAHMMGKGCHICKHQAIGRAKSMSREEFIAKAVEIHGDRYDYSEAIMNGTKNSITIICKEHGPFVTTPGTHIANRTRNCPKCGKEIGREKKTKTTEWFISEAKKVHGDKYDYSSTTYIGRFIDLTIICREHGEFKQTPGSHFNGGGCPVCAQLDRNEKQSFTTDDFLRLAKEKHGDTYNYDEAEYTSAKGPVAIICKKHGKFYQSAFEHYSAGCGCPRCSTQKSAKEFELLQFINYFTPASGRNRKILGGNREIDIFIPSAAIGIEYNGTIWHSERFSKDPIQHMRKKQIEARAKGIRLIHVSELSDLTIVKKTLAHILGINDEKYFARKCQTGIGKSSDPKIRRFFEENHLQGNAEGCWVGYLTVNNQIVCAMAFSLTSSERGNTDFTRYELRRFASVCRVVGGASRLLKMFIREHPGCSSIISYSDNAWFTGGMYAALGFSLVKEVRPEYIYIKGAKVRKKGQMKREVMAKLEGFDFNPDESEHQNALRNKWYRLYDCGKKKWELKVK